MTAKTTDYCDISVHNTVPKVVRYNAKKYPDEVALREKDFGIWVEHTWADYYDAVRWLGLGMREMGLKRGDVLGLLGESRPEWIWGKIGAHAVGAISLGIYQDSIGEEVSYLINYSEARFILAEDEEQVDKILELFDELKTVEKVIYCDPRGMRKYDDDRLVSIEDVYQIGKNIEARSPDLFDHELDSCQPEDVATFLATSGTTGRPKLSMMQGGPFLQHAYEFLKYEPKYPGDNYVAVLPLPWVIEQKFVIFQAPIARVIVNMVEEQESMMEDLREIGPHSILLAPRAWETIAADVRSRMMDSSRFKNMMFNLGMKLGGRALDKGRKSWLAELILFRALRDRLGFTYLRSATTGGAAMGPDTFRFFLAMQVPLRQLYGQTELGGAYTIHEYGDVDFNTVGKAFSNSEIRIEGKDANGVGEIVAKTAGMFSGYFKNEKATNEDVRDGWMFTGDAGYFDDKDHLVVIDRIKDIAVTSGGDNFSPMFIENKLKFSQYIAEAVILGHEKPYLAAIICLRYSTVAKWAEQRGIAFTNYANLASRPQIYDLIRDEMIEVNKSLQDAHKIQKFILLYKELDADDGELTRTRKVRRSVVNEKYDDIISMVYSDDNVVHVDTTIAFQDGTKSRIVTDLKIEKLSGGLENT